MANSWIICTDSQIANLVSVAQQATGVVNVVVVGDAQISGVDRVIRIAVPDAVPAEALAGAVANAVVAQAGDVVIAANSAAGRVFAGAVAAKLDAPVLNGVKEIASGSANLLRFGGISAQNVSFDSAVVVVMEGIGALADGAQEADEAAGDVYAATVTSSNASEAKKVNLAAARRIVAAGRGFAKAEDLELARELAQTLDAELGCSRPLAEGAGWLERDAYVGISGQHVAPDIYVAVGISGQIQHTAGMVDSKTVIAINSDDKAVIFEKADYGIVGDLYTVLPELAQALK
ncbi:electron transfer flavoprotein subunit alpha/FixB family protein [Arcanobacterium bovis]|uniref:Electron transfer flavoprotein subunit alpha/FixB family protein n=1 Tax=Arcanobacterium bovis TaxID=2529275 RepID=A0A4V2KRA7_9ACTO|nr:electron transfer flavoprotein subunit alpha/FixB family protein [Arcanobacterium bovis]TBW23714.1 electron transfer flavoprotein subunit alpha/FixB family protein [Arcanobacterium bovis]